MLESVEAAEQVAAERADARRLQDERMFRSGAVAQYKASMDRLGLPPDPSQIAALEKA